MGKFKSVIILKNKVLVPDYDDHSYILKKYGVADSYLNTRKNFVKAELLPKDKDVFSDIDTWTLKIDQNVVPDWYDKKTYKPMVVEAVKRWAKGHIYIGVNNFKIDAGTNYYIKDCKNVEITGDAVVERVCGHTVINKISGKAMIKTVCEGTKIDKMCGNSIIKTLHDAVITEICGNAIIKKVMKDAIIKKAKEYAIIIAPSSGWNNKDNLRLGECATFKDYETHTIYQAGDWNILCSKNRNARLLSMFS